MKKRSVSLTVVLMMLFSMVVPGFVVYAQHSDTFIAEASVQKDNSKDPEFDENKPFTMAMLDEADDVESYEIDMENDGISIKNFSIETETEDGMPGSCQLEFPKDLTEIKPGELKSNVPALLGDEDHGNGHAYSYAHVGETEVFYIGKLEIHGGEQTENYIVYTTDKHIDKRTVYVVLKDGEKINLVYKHGTYYTIDYRFENMAGQPVNEEGEDGEWTYDKIFGHDRINSVASGKNFNGTVTIPRGYKATVLVKDKEGKDLHEPMELGKMMKYSLDPTNSDRIQAVEGNKDALKFKESYTMEDVEQDITVIVRYEKINSFAFSAKLWRNTVYANGRFYVRTGEDINSADQPANDTNCMVTFGNGKNDYESNNSFTWNFNSITSGGATWEMDQLEINGEAIAVPMTSIDSNETITTTTPLSSGTVITMKVKSLGVVNGMTKRAYTLKAENCYEDLTISGGNLVGSAHKEFATRRLIGVKDAQYWKGSNTSSTSNWDTLTQSTLIGKKEDADWMGSDTFRMKSANGYGKLNVSFTDKETNVLQTNDDSPAAGTTNNYIQYLIRTDINNTSQDSDNLKIYGTYKKVSYDKWEPSADGYYYCKADPSLRSFMQSADKNGVVFLWFYADADMYGIDYKNGADESGASAPSTNNIDNLPLYQDGGEDGYNLINNTKALVSNHVPIDKSGKFVFDHWEILKAGENGSVNEVKLDKDGNTYMLEAGANLPLSKEALDELSDCLYYNNEQKRNTLTLRAVWRSREGKAPIPYTVNYYITEIKNGSQADEPILLEGHQHMANEGATLVADLWQDGNKTLSPIIQEILERDNDQHTDYTEGGKVKYVIYEKLTNKKLENISLNNNVVNIYLVKQPNLTVGKTVEGKHGDLTKQFNFKIKLSGDGASLNGTYKYTGGTVDGVNGATAPADKTLTFTDGEAEISLSHGQQITFTNLPFGSHYTVTETKEDGYDTVYNDVTTADKAEGVLESDQIVNVKNTKTDIAVTGIAGDANRFGVMLAIGATALLILTGMGIWRSRKKI